MPRRKADPDWLIAARKRQKKLGRREGDVYLSRGRPLVIEHIGRYDPRNWQAEVSVAPTLSRFYECEYGSEREVKARARQLRRGVRGKRKQVDVLITSKIKNALPGQSWAVCRRRSRR